MLLRLLLDSSISMIFIYAPNQHFEIARSWLKQHSTGTWKPCRQSWPEASIWSPSTALSEAAAQGQLHIVEFLFGGKISMARRLSLVYCRFLRRVELIRMH
jgi:hypothetical protein